MALLEIHSLSVGIRLKQKRPAGLPAPAVDGIDLTIGAGEITALAGESGCGKTLSALSVMRLLPPAAVITGGKIRYQTASGETEDLCSLAEESMRPLRGKEIAMIFQEPALSLNPLMKAGAQIAETLTLRGADKKTAEEAAMDILRRLNFPQPEKVFNAWPHRLSGGMCQRVMIAMAAVNRPRLLIADEPSSALDEAAAGHCISLLEQINREFGTAILFISHDLKLAARLSSRMLVMYAGKIIEEGPSGALLAAPRHPYTGALIAAMPGKERRGRPLDDIPGIAPAIDARPPGCAFAPRCPRAREICVTEAPRLTGAGEGRLCRCFFKEAEYG